MERMTNNRLGILFVCDADAHLSGVLSDGDVRRTMLDNALLGSPIDKIMNTDPVHAATEVEATQLVRSKGLIAVPVLDSEGCIRAVAVEDRNIVSVLKPAAAPELVEGSSTRTVVAIIPARGGSKRIPRKNLAVVGGKTLVAWAIEAAKASRHISRVIVSTEDPEIAHEAAAYGVEVPWLRPESLARDDTPTIHVLIHALTWASEHLIPKPEIGVLLEPTAPLRRPGHIDEAIELLDQSSADSVMSISEVPHVLNPEELLVCDEKGVRPYLASRTMDTRRPRGEQAAAYVQNGLVYAFRIPTVLGSRSLYGHHTIPLYTEWDEFLDIDTPEDLRWANLRMGRRTMNAR